MDGTTPFQAYSQELRQTMAAIGPVWGTDIGKYRDMVWAAFDPLLRAAPKDGVAVTRNVAYGPHARHVLDIYRPERVKAGAPVVVFVHGGAFVRGSKDVGEGYGNVLTWFARQGYLGINMEYRLAPEAAYPGGADDIAKAVSWVKQSAAAHGGNPDRVFLIGHSAGGTHVGTYAVDPAAGYLGKDVRGVVILSGRLRADVSPENPNAGGVKAYFGTDESKYDIRSPATHAANGKLPTFVAVAEFENPLLDLYGLEFAHRMSVARRKAIRFIQMAGHNHISMVAHFNTQEDFLGREILNFFASIA